MGLDSHLELQKSGTVLGGAAVANNMQQKDSSGWSF